MSLASQSAVSRSGTLAGIALMLLGIFLFSCNDALGKWLLGSYSVWQMLLIRSIAALALLAPFIWREGVAGFAAAPRPGLQVFRIALSTLESVMFFFAVIYLPLADATVFYLAAPIYITALSVPFLGETVGWRRWSAVLVGFAGVLIALRPSAATLSLPALIALVGGFFFALQTITTRQVRGTSDVVLVTGQMAGMGAVSAVAAPFAWTAPTTRDVALMAILGVVAMVAFACINRALKLAPASVLAPYTYTMMVWAAVLGYAVFGDVPDAAMLAGTLIIVAAGLYIFWREQIVARHEPVVAPPPA